MTALGQFIAVEVPILSAATFAAVGYAVRRIIGKADERSEVIDRKLAHHDDALALLVNQVMPAGAPSLVETLHAMHVRQVIIGTRLGLDVDGTDHNAAPLNVHTPPT